MNSDKDIRKKEARDANRDPITKAPGSHPVGTAVGATVGGAAGIAGGAAASAATGMATGTVLGGPAGAAVGLVAGAVVGGLAGKAVGEKIDPTREEQYWRQAYRSEPYHDPAFGYDDYAPAYRTGYEGYGRYGQQSSFEKAEPTLQQDYERNRGKSRLGWDKARAATRSAWSRLSGGGSRERRAIESEAEADTEAE